MGLRKKIAVVAVGLALGVGGAVAASAPADAAVVPNMMLCEPDTGWCFQTNPPYNSSVPHYCRWDYKLNGNNLRSGMWYTGCDIWGPAIY